MLLSSLSPPGFLPPPAAAPIYLWLCFGQSTPWWGPGWGPGQRACPPLFFLYLGSSEWERRCIHHKAFSTMKCISFTWHFLGTGQTYSYSRSNTSLQSSPVINKQQQYILFPRLENRGPSIDIDLYSYIILISRPPNCTELSISHLDLMDGGFGDMDGSVV